MPDYKKMYGILAAAMSNSIEVMQKAMQDAEEVYMADENSSKLKLVNFSSLTEDEHLEPLSKIE